MSIRIAAAIAVLTTFLFACAPQEQVAEVESSWAGGIEDRDGVTYVTNPAEGVWASGDETSVRWDLEQTFGVDVGDDDAMLGAVRDVAVDADGNVYAIDAQRNRIVAFDSRGNVRWAVGQEGQGPRDFYRVQGIAWDGGSSLYVANQSGARLDRWDTNGSYVGTHSLEERVHPRSNLLGTLAPDVVAFDEPSSTGIGSAITALQIADPLRPAVKIASEDAATVAAELGSSDYSCVTTSLGSAGMGSMMATNCRTPWRVASGRVFMGSNSEYNLRAYDTNGSLRTVVTRPVEYMQPPATHFYRDRFRFLVHYSTVSAPFELHSGHWFVPTHWLDEVDDADELLRRTVEQDLAPSNPLVATFDYFDPEGRFLGSVRRDEENFRRIGQPRLVGPDGKVYTISTEPFPQVRRFHVEAR